MTAGNDKLFEPFTLGDLTLPNRVLMVVPPGSDLPAGHPAAGKSAVESQATAYVCPGQTCLAPVTDPSTLAAQLDSL